VYHGRHGAPFMGQPPAGAESDWGQPRREGGGERGAQGVLGTGTGPGQGRRWFSRPQVLHAVTQCLLQTHDDGHLHEQVHHAATEMALWGPGRGSGVELGGGLRHRVVKPQERLTSSSFHRPARRVDFPG
jgi:hypothetical protein